MNETPKLGQLLDATTIGRDAVHIAIVPVTAMEQLTPGEPVGLVDTEHVSWRKKPHIGIVDPFLTDAVEAEERFYLFLFPGTVTSLRHVWTHSAFTAASNTAKEKLP